jgi:hypothetical protein
MLSKVAHIFMERKLSKIIPGKKSPISSRADLMAAV